MKYMKRFVTAVVFCIILSLLAIANEDNGEKGKSFTVTKGGILDIAVNLGNIHITTWDKNEATVRVSSDDEEEDDDVSAGVRIRQTGNTLRIDNNRHYVDYGVLDIYVSIPSQFNIQIQTSAGDIMIEGKIIGTIEAQTSGGNISTGSVEGKVDVQTSGGDITTEDIKGDLLLNTSGGNIRTGVVTGVADISTLGGDIDIERVSKQLNAETSGGNVHVGDIGGDAVISTSGGDIILEDVAGGATLKTAGGNITLRSAKGAVIAKTAGGDIRADSIIGSLDAKTSAGNIDVLLIPSGTGKSKLSTSVGDVRLYIPENAKASIDARNRRRDWGVWNDDEEVIYSDYKENTYDRDGRNREVIAKYILNGGGQTITIDANMGNISILKPDSRIEKNKHKPKRKNK